MKIKNIDDRLSDGEIYRGLADTEGVFISFWLHQVQGPTGSGRWLAPMRSVRELLALLAPYIQKPPVFDLTATGRNAALALEVDMDTCQKINAQLGGTSHINELISFLRTNGFHPEHDRR